MADFDLFRAVLDSLPEGIAVLDLAGNIIATNSSWDRGAANSEDCLARGVVGENYFSSLEGVSSSLHNKAREVASGVKSVLEGGLSSFEIDYPWDATLGERWFQLRVQTYRVEGRLEGALVFHADITRRKLAEIDLTRRTQELTEAERSLQENLALLRKKIRFETIISAVARRVHQSLDLSEVFRQTVSAVKDNVDEAEFVALYMVEGDEAVLKAEGGCPDWYIGRVARIPSPKGYTWKTIREGKTVYCSDTDEDTVIGPAAKELGVKSYISVPIADATGATIGCFNVNSTHKGAFDEDTPNVLEIVAHQIGIAVENARRAEALRRSEEALREKIVQLSKKSRFDAILAAIMRSVHSTINLEHVLENTVSAIHENLDSAQHVAVFLVQGGYAVLMAQRGYPDWYIDRIRRIPAPKGHTWWTIIEGKPRVCLDVDKDGVIGPAGRELGIGSYVSVPLFFGSSTIGCINITSMSKGAFDEEEIHLLEIVAKQIEVAISNAKQAEALRESEEKFKIAFESSPDVIMVIDLKGDTILSVNPAIERVLGYYPSSVVGKHLSTIHDDPAILKNKIVTAALSGSGMLYITVDLKKVDGSLCPVEISSTMIPWGGTK
ncbi:MAG: GAF domain-containing protein, partial [Candidatus Caldarchaeum sp.]